MEGKNKFRKQLIILCIAPFLVFWHWFEPVAKKNASGIEAYQSQKYEEALKDFLSAKGLNPELPELKNNTASALYQMKNYEKALEEFSKIDPEKTSIPKEQFFYNLGNTYFRLEKYDKALECYKISLMVNGTDLDTKKNFELTLKKIEEQEQKKKEDKKDDQDKKDQEKEQEKEKEPPPQQKHQDILQYLNQNDKDQMQEQKQKVKVQAGEKKRKEKDW